MNEDQGYSQQQMFEMLMESQYWSREQMQEYQRSQLEQMLRHARANVPFYKTRLDCMFRRDGSINWDRWEEIPILTKEELRDNFEELQASEIPEAHGHVSSNHSSGTTGHAIKVQHSELERDLWQALAWRAHTWWKLDWTRNMMHWPAASAEASQNLQVNNDGYWGPPWLMEGMTSGYSLSMPRNAPLAKRVAAIRDNQVAYLNTLPNVAFAAALECQRNKDWPKVKLATILGYSGAAEPEHKQICRDVFGAKYCTSYASTEAGRIAYSCPNSESYHISEECVICEVVDNSGAGLGPDEEGQVVVTPFLCSAMPLIRYSQGDLTRRLGTCSCGISLRRIAPIHGREHHMFLRDDGLKIAPSVPDWVRKELNITSWQIAQVASQLVEVRYIRATELDQDQCAWGQMKFSESMGQEFDYAFVQVSEMKISPSGKFIKYVNEYSTTR